MKKKKKKEGELTELNEFLEFKEGVAISCRCGSGTLPPNPTAVKVTTQKWIPSTNVQPLHIIYSTVYDSSIIFIIENNCGKALDCTTLWLNRRPKDRHDWRLLIWPGVYSANEISRNQPHSEMESSFWLDILVEDFHYLSFCANSKKFLKTYWATSTSSLHPYQRGTVFNSRRYLPSRLTQLF